MEVKTFLILFVAAMALTCCDAQSKRRQRTPEERQRFKDWRQKFQANYRNEEEELNAMENLLENQKKIDEHNKLFAEGKETYTQGLWKHSDLSTEEKKMYLTGLLVPPETRSLPVAQVLPTISTGPSSVDWRAQGLVGPVMDQGEFSMTLILNSFLKLIFVIRLVCKLLGFFCGGMHRSRAKTEKNKFNSVITTAG